MYLSGGLVLAYAGYSIVILSQMGLGASITPDYRQRSRVFAWWQVFNTLGLILVMAMLVIFADRIANDSSFTVRTMGWFVLATVPVTILVTTIFVREGAGAPPAHSAALRDYLDLFRLGSTRLLLTTQMMIGLASASARRCSCSFSRCLSRFRSNMSACSSSPSTSSGS